MFKELLRLWDGIFPVGNVNEINNKIGKLQLEII